MIDPALPSRAARAALSQPPIAPRHTASAQPPCDRVELRKDLPDLIITKLDPSDSFPFPGESVTVEVTVKNQGTAAAGPFNVSTSTYGPDDDKQRVKDGLAAGKSAKLSLGPIYMDDGPALEVTAYADSDNEVAESNEKNNQSEVVLWSPNPPEPTPYPPIPPIPPRP